VEDFAKISPEEIELKGKKGILDNLKAIWEEHRDEGWDEFENEEITRYVCEKITLGETEFLSDKTKDQFRSLYRLIAERIRQHQEFVSRADSNKITKAKI